MARRSKLVVSAALVLVAVLVLAATGGFWWWSRGGRPQRAGEAAAPVSAPVTVRWDARGVPYVEAASEDDLAAALGWLHANDRMTQMELGRRLAAGRIAELVGAAAVPVDTESRRMRFRAGAERLWQDAGPASRRWLVHYARGVNAWLAARDGDLPPGLRLLGGPGFRPEPWTPVDSLSFVFLMGQDLSFWAGRPEEERFRWLAALGEERVRDLLGGELHVPAEIAALAAAAPPPELAGRATAGGAAPGGGSPGSNNWALAGERTASGAPLLANDPHLPLALPGTWYMVHLRAPGLETAGFSLPGVPGIVIGRGRAVAWALTNVMLDDHDLFFERVRRGPDGGETVQRGAAWVAVDSATETIAVDGGRPVEVEVRWTDHGPLLPAEPERGLPERSLAWTLHHGGDPLAAFLGLARAESLADAMAAVGSYTGPAQNLVAAHPEGGILWTVLGRVPHRRAGDGRLPAPGWAAEYGWDGLRPRGTAPAIVAPPEGLIVTANARVQPADHPFPMTADYDTAHRAERIRQRLLAATTGWDVAATAALQLDVVSLYAREMLVHALAALPDELPPALEADAAAARDLFGAWDGTMASRDGASPDEPGRPQPAAALFAFFVRRFEAAAFADEEAAYGVEDLADRERLLWVLDGTMSEAWLDDVSTPAVETKGEVVAAALAAAWRDAVAALGADPGGWDYEEMHRLRLAHPLGRAPLLGRFFDRGPFPVPGSATTVAAFGARWDGDRQHVTYGPSMRWVVDLADPDSAVAVLPAGQSGHPFDPHYDDQVDAYLAGRTYPFPWTAEAIGRQAVERLVLRPEAGR